MNSPAVVGRLERGVRPRAWLLEPKEQRHPHKPIQRGCYTEEPSKEQQQIADLDGDRYVPMYALPADWALFEVVNLDGMTEAATEGPREAALANAMHYASQYWQDGTVTVFEVLRVPLVVIAGPNVRAKRATTAGRQAPGSENVHRTTARGLVACRWRSA